MSAAYTTVGCKNYLGVPLPDIEVYFQDPMPYPQLVPVTNTDGIAKIWLDHNALGLRGTFYFHDPAGIYTGDAVTRTVDFNNDDIPEWVTLEMNVYVPPQQDLS